MTCRSLWPSSRWARSFLIVFAGGLVEPCVGLAQPAADTAESLVEIFEALEREEDPGAEVPDPAQLERAYRDLQAFLKASPDDVRGLILLARTGRILRLSNSVVLTQEQVSSDAPSADASIASLEHALEIEPTSAESHYWLARTYGMATPKIVDDVFRIEPLDVEQAVLHARRAVELSPAQLRYREVLGIYLAESGRYGDAIAAFGGDEHVVRRILLDLETVPLPAGARYLPVESVGLAETMASRGRFADFGALRVRTYLIEGPSSTVAAAFRGRWPDFELYEADREGTDGGTEVITLVQMLREADGALQPIPVEEVARVVENDPDGELLVTVLEFIDPTEELLAQFHAAGTDGFTLLSLASIRKPAYELVPLNELGQRLLGEWEIDEWSYRGSSGRESYTGTLSITAQRSEAEFEGELFSRNQDGNWGRQRMRIIAQGDRLELTGRVVAAGGLWSPDNLSLTLERDRLSGRSVDSEGDGGEVTFVKSTR